MVTLRCACGRDIDIGPLEGNFRVTCAACLPPEGLEFPIETQSASPSGHVLEIAKIPLYILWLLGSFTAWKLNNVLAGAFLGTSVLLLLLAGSWASSGRVEVHHDFLRVTPRVGFSREWMWEGLGFVRARESPGDTVFLLELGLPGSGEVAQSFRDSRLTPGEARRIVRAISQTRASFPAYVLHESRDLPP